MSDVDIISRGASQFYFERSPPHQEQRMKQMMDEEVNVKYELHSRETKVKTVSTNEKGQEVNDHQLSDKEAKRDNSGPLKADAVIEKVLKMKEVFPEFDTSTETVKMDVISRIINGEFDNIVMEGINLNE